METVAAFIMRIQTRTTTRAAAATTSMVTRRKETTVYLLREEEEEEEDEAHLPYRHYNSNIEDHGQHGKIHCLCFPPVPTRKTRARKHRHGYHCPVLHVKHNAFFSDAAF
jgi:hypothetical protein